jgi:uncharacterized cofD-like protein
VAGTTTRGEVEVDAAHNRGPAITRLWLEPEVQLHPAAAAAIPQFDAVVIGPGSFFTSLMPILLVGGTAQAVQNVPGPVIVVSNLLTEGRGMASFTAADAVHRITEALGRPVDVVIANTGRPPDGTLERYRAEDKLPLELGNIPSWCEAVTGDFWRGDIARHDRRRLAAAVWAVLAKAML